MSNTSTTVLAIMFAVAVDGAAAVAGQLPPGALTGNPTPGVEQPAPPVIADRIAVTGCVARLGPTPADPNSYSEGRFELHEREKGRQRPGAALAVSAAATAPIATRYRLAAIDTFLAPFVGKRVELAGEIINPTTGTAPTLRVEFVQKLAATCQ